MLFIKTNEDNLVEMVHYMPFDEVNGLHKTEEELSQEGVLLEEIPEPEMREGCIAQAYYTEEKGFYYEYEPIPMDTMFTIDGETYTQITERLHQLVEQNKITQEDYNYVLGI